ncbi:MAG: hypothetical protein J6T08_08080 [Lentisphaeria bacterium]|nr:hypothetical protein [Lentisphaeria bacterium]
MKCHLIKISVTIILLGLAAVGGFWYKKSFIDTAVQENGFNENRVSVNSANFPALQDKYPYRRDCEGLVKLELPHLRLLPPEDIEFFNKNHRELALLFTLCHMYEAIPEKADKRKISIFIYYYADTGYMHLAENNEIRILNAMKKIFPKSEITTRDVTFIKNKDGFRVPHPSHDIVFEIQYDPADFVFSTILFQKGEAVFIKDISNGICYSFATDNNQLYVKYIGGFTQ